ncbi:probable Mitochondrial presequence protease [Zygosaccharomyces bailii]|nr:probable Mitochondrial presequence protease [Zygosaccharomyces bailii]
MLRFQRYASSYAQSKILRRYPVGGVIHGYEVKRILPIPELKLTAVDLVHERTGSEHLHIDRDDKNNVFTIGFKTNPPDATGVPHILEHTTLCGSVKYPVRDPFFKMLNRSLANFMNAMTGPDYTLYPFSTTNKADFANLRDVYVDATYNPLLKPEDFYQEGWRLEHSDVANPRSDIVFKGVVYNEMKGQVSNANYHFWIQFHENIYPSLHNSGGDPQKITDLHYQDLVDFHSANYHPSNAKTFTYGNFPLEESLKRLNEEYVQFGKRHKSQKILLPVALKENTEVKTVGQADPMLPPERQLKTSMTWICGKPQDTYKTFLLRVLGNLLMDGHSSVLYQRLIESGMGLEFTVNSGVDSTSAANFITVGLQGVQDVEQFRQAVNDIFTEVADGPFNRQRIEAILQQLELSKKDHKSDFGLQLSCSLIPSWTNCVDPFESLLFDDVLARFREDLEKKGDSLFQDLIKKYILDKPCFLFTMQPSKDFALDLEIEEKERLAAKVSKLDENDKEVIYKRGLMLQEKQNAKEDLSSLPSLQVSDIPREEDTYAVTRPEPNVWSRVTDTNGICYLRAKIPLQNSIPQELYPYLPLFADSLTSLGTTTEEYSDIEDAMKLHTGGISAMIDVSADPITLRPHLHFRVSGWSLNSKTDHVFDIWKKLLLETDFERHSEKLKILIRSLASSNTSAVAESGHSFARGYSSASFSTTRAIGESLTGVEQLQLINKLNGLLEDEELFRREVVDKLVELKKRIITSQGIEFFVTTDSDAMVQSLQNQISQFQSSLPDTVCRDGLDASQFPLLPSNHSVLINFPFQVHYSARSMPGVPYTHKDGAPLQVLANLLTFKYLHREIREKGGAYGGGANYSALDGMLNFFSYRDPHPLESLATFKGAGAHAIQDAHWAKPDLDEAKLSIFQKVDSPISRKSEGTSLFYSGVTDEMRQVRREQLLDVSKQDIDRVIETYLLNKPGVNAVVGPPIEGKTTPPEWQIKNL